MRAILVTLSLSALLLAGCSKGEDGEAGSGEPCTLEPVLCDPSHYLATHYCIVNDVRPRVYAPDTPGPDSVPDPWTQGEYWTYSLKLDGTPKPDTTLVYYDDADFSSSGRAEHYMVGTPTRAEALEHALFSTNPMIGRIHRSLYSPHESGEHADMFNFPLCAGNTWQTTFYGTNFAMRAEQADVAIPGGTDALGFRIIGTGSDGSTLENTYSPDMKWFTHLKLDRADGLKLEMELKQHDLGKSGTFYFLRAQDDEIIDVATVDATQGMAVPREDGGSGPYDKVALHLEAQRTAGTGKIEVHVKDPAGQTVACVGTSATGAVPDLTTCPSGPLSIEVPYQAGSWSVTVTKPILPGTSVAGEVRIVSVYDRSGTV